MAEQQQSTMKELKQKSYSYFDILKLESKSIYSSIGDMVVSHKPSAPKFSFGTSTRNGRRKNYQTQQIAKIDLAGQEGNGPAAYFPSTDVIVKNNKKIVLHKENLTDHFRFNEMPRPKIGTQQRPDLMKPKYDYYKTSQDYIRPEQADRRRRQTQSCVRIGLDPRWKYERKDNITPGPGYDPILRPEVPIAPKYTFGYRRQRKGQDPLIQQTATNQIVGPATYHPIKSQSAKILRIPPDSRIENVPTHGFPKGPKTLITHKKAIEETYDIKTGTIMAHYDFQYDGGKGRNTGTSWKKEKIHQSTKNPLERNRMKSYTIGKSERQDNRGVFQDTMINRPTPVRISHPKF